MQLIYKNLKLNSTFLNNKLWDADSNCHNYNNHRITITNIETKKRTSFEYWASVINPKIKTETDMLSALYCFLTDAASGTENFKTFCSYHLLARRPRFRF